MASVYLQGPPSMQTTPVASRLCWVRDNSELPAPTVGGLDALRHALQVLLRDREPSSPLPPHLARSSRALPGYEWDLLIIAVMDGLLSTRFNEDFNAISTTFNTLTGLVQDPPTSSDSDLSELRIEPRLDLPMPGEDLRAAARTPVAVTITAREARTLRVIKELPAYPFCQLEGRNGIGKTLAARLLELISGTQPYSALPYAWSTLKQQLGPTTVTVTGLHAGTLQITLTPISWPEMPLEGIGDSLGTATLNDAAITWAEVRSLLQVIRISGDESLVDALAKALEELAQQAIRWRALLNAVVEQWNKPLLDLQDTLNSLSMTHFDALLSDVTNAKAIAATGKDVAQKATQTADLTTQAQIMLQNAVQRREQVPTLLQQLSQTNATLAQNATDQQSVGQELLRASKALGLDGQRRQDVARWERLRTLRYRALQRAQSDEDWYLLQLGDDERPTWQRLSDRRKEVERRRRKAIDILAELDVTAEVRKLGIAVEAPLNRAPTTVLRQVIARTDSSLTGRALLEGVRRRRIEIEGRPTSAEVQVARDDMESAENEQKLLQYLSAAMETTDRKRENLDEAEAVLRGLLDQLQGISQEAYESILDRMRALQEDRAAQIQQREGLRIRLARLLSQKATEPSESESKLPKPSASADEEDAEEQSLLSGHLVTTDSDRLDTLSTAEEDRLDLPIDPVEWIEMWDQVSNHDRVELLRLGYELTPGSFRKADPEDPGDELAAALQIATVAAQEASRWARDKSEEVTEALETLQLQQDAIVQARHHLRTAARVLTGTTNAWRPWLPGFLRLLEVVGGSRNDIEVMNSTEISLDEISLTDAEKVALRWTETIDWLCNRISIASDGIRDGLDSVAGILQSQAQSLSPRSTMARGDEADRGIPTDYIDIASVRDWAEGELASLLNAPALRHALFDDAPDVHLDLDTATVYWTAPASPYESRRPLEAFSSGEQVFAYTRARLEQLNPLDSKRYHRIVILDEFGAFVARNRFAQLLGFVFRQALGSLADQIIVMLPLSSDFANEAYAQELVRGANNATRRNELLDRVRQVEENGYFAVPVEVTHGLAPR